MKIISCFTNLFTTIYSVVNHMLDTFMKYQKYFKVTYNPFKYLGNN